MIKRFSALLAVLLLAFGLLAGCGKNKVSVITQEEAYAIVLKDLGEDVTISGEPHAHIGNYENQVCYSFYLTVDGESVSYVISTSGEILDKGHGSHSH